MDNAIELRQVVGQVAGSFDPQSVEPWDRDEILCHGRRVGFVDRAVGAPCLFTGRLGAAARQAISLAVAELQETRYPAAPEADHDDTDMETGEDE